MRNLSFCTLILLLYSLSVQAQNIPLPEHPNPIYERPDWQNLNGTWAFAFDADDEGIEKGWTKGLQTFNRQINVPFPWGSQLSGVKDEADIGWYQRDITVVEDWKGKRTFLTIGASDWETMVWLDGQLVGKHQGGYIPFSFELTQYLEYGENHKLVIRVDDKRRDFTLYGKQGYGNARGIWQTIYLESRGNDYLEALHFSPDIDQNKVKVTAYLPEAAGKDMSLTLNIKTAKAPATLQLIIPKGKTKFKFEILLPQARLWELDNPFLYEVKATLEDDILMTYFGMRKISVANLPGTEFPYIALNNQPVYMQLALDQSYHPGGFYTFPSDQFMKEEILRSKSIGLNGIRTHIKVEVPRKLYWADKLGLLVMEDLPNSWGEPDEKMQAESEYTLREMIKRDYNHPSIFSWVIFNETWGLYSKTGKDKSAYLPETQAWVASMYYLAKSLDQTRLVEDNSICCGRGHTETDINSWHVYLPGWEWDNYLKELDAQTYEGSRHHFEKGFRQGRQPNINSECGNVWGYSGSTGDVDWSWDYHRMMNTFRMYPKVGGWLYTEHHDVINEWNGYWRFDRTEKETGFGDIVENMSLKDLHADVYLSTGNEICKTVKGGEIMDVPLHLSVMSGADFGNVLIIDYELMLTNTLGKTDQILKGVMEVPYEPWMQKKLDPLSFQMANEAGVVTLKLRVKSSADGKVLQRNFMHFEVHSDHAIPKTKISSIKAKSFSKAVWSKKHWNIMEGKKVNGAGKGYFEYDIKIPKDMRLAKVKKAYFLVEASAKELFVKDRVEFDRNQDYMKGDKVFPSSNPNAYPMTDETLFPTTIAVSLNGTRVQTMTLPDDPADHRGVLSWHHQLKDRKLREAGSYGYLLEVPVKKSLLRKAVKTGSLKVKLEARDEGGIAIYGKEFGRYALDPSLVIEER